MDFRKRITQPRPLIIDGAMGTMVFRRLPGYRDCIEKLNLDRPDVIGEIHRAYAEAGADIVETNTFGGSPIKLAEYGLAERCEEINREAARIARAAVAGRDVYVAGNIGPLGKLVEPMGYTGVDQAFDAFALQAKSLAEGGADLIVIETMTDLQEARLACVAVRSVTDLPLICSMSFEESGKTVSGTDMLTAFATLAQSGADAVGANCSMGPHGLVKLYEENMHRIEAIGVPFTVWSNAGLPEIRNGEVVYTITPEEFSDMSARFAGLGISVIGGCCGTTPEHIAALTKRLGGYEAAPRGYGRRYRFITSRFHHLDLQERSGVLLIGERLNPTARKKFAEELKEGSSNFLREESKKQQAEGADMLDINVGVPGIDEIAAMRRSISILASNVKTPLVIDSDNGAVLEAALRLNPGIAMINSINAKKKSLDTVLPLLARYGSFVVGLCMDDTGIHRESAKRINIGEKLLESLAAGGIDSRRVFIDPLILTESAEPGSAVETIRVIEYFARKGIKTSIGLSNISFGLPQRKYINNVFLNMAAKAGLSAAIVNPSAVSIGGEMSDEERLAYDFLTGKDENAVRYIGHFRENPLAAEAAGATGAPKAPGDIEAIYAMVVEGNTDEIKAAVERALVANAPEKIMNEALIRALEKVGEYYSTGEYFLPQMIASAEAMKAGFMVLKPLLKKGSIKKKGKVVICTVRGDVHDIGKNIVAMMLENHGFEVVDLGKDVPSEEVIEAVRQHRPDILALSSLLTTTMTEMKVLADMVRAENLPVRVLIGGAVVNLEYATGIGAAYGEDAVDGVRAANAIMEAL